MMIAFRVRASFAFKRFDQKSSYQKKPIWILTNAWRLRQEIHNNDDDDNNKNNNNANTTTT